ncbi:MAG: helix-hairpin-helix domain-containing protein [Acidimicrobiia bacterium]|nr:helix-hairpin-helix domain-containing protein [Acidimicrobiia bacterium]
MGEPSFVKIRDRVESAPESRMARLAGRLPWVPRRDHAILLAVTAVAIGVVAVTWIRSGPVAPVPEALPPVSVDEGPGATAGGLPGETSAGAAAATIRVHVAGAVAVAGVYDLESDARTTDAIERAGGASADADLSALNLAARLADGQRVYVPRAGEAIPPEQGQAGSGAAGTGGAPVNLNTAGPDELDSLPGIGEATADAIIEHRTRNGLFRSVEDLLDVPGIGDSKLARLEGLVTV